MKTKVHNLKSDKKGSITLDDGVFGVEWNNDLVYQSVVTHRANTRQKIAHTKGTSDVRGGGRKPWRQKGTGRARHGTIRSPLWKGGGVTFGPSKQKKFGKKLNKKMKRKALFSVLSKKLDEGEVIIVDSLVLEDNKTKNGKKIVDQILDGVEEKGTLLFVPELNNKGFYKAVKNITDVHAMRSESLNIYDLLSYKYVVFDKKSVKELEDHFKINKK